MYLQVSQLIKVCQVAIDNFLLRKLRSNLWTCTIVCQHFLIQREGLITYEHTSLYIQHKSPEMVCNPNVTLLDDLI